MSRNISSPDVALHYDPRAWSYATDPPFHPQIRYPEYDGPLSRSGTPNAAYDAVRETLHLLQLDDAHYGRMDWNPLGNFVSPGQMVAIKPNLVMHRHLRGGSLNCVITHGSIIRAVVDYACLALQGRGRIVIGDAPLQMADFDAICECNGLHEIAHYAQSTWGVNLDVVDFRRVRAVTDHGHVVRVEEKDRDPRGYVVVDLAEASMLAAVSEASDRFRVTCYGADAVGQHHNEHKNEYLVSGSILQADCVISISKLKTHRKAGLTAALKNRSGNQRTQRLAPASPVRRRKGTWGRVSTRERFQAPFSAVGGTSASIAAGVAAGMGDAIGRCGLRSQTSGSRSVYRG